ncbi:hypothetical protein PoB_003353700 [Plakobranchus ocellatus]|uniref:DUF218 domain-containing protein n=1 Tax=Plakobranchus ocellatus TaxID=259542 RepID=A0AAV4AJF7_9GAST|nr:hypothetical protein PoB_003353700 [Plakobranchus ocellatus]
MREPVMQCAKILWDFARLNQIPVKSDVMIVLGNDDPRSAEHAADLFLEGWAPLVVISGKEGSGTRGNLPPKSTEAELFQELMVAKGVCKRHILLEKESTNTGENIRLSQALLRRAGIFPDSVMVVTKSVMELRVALTFKKQWEGAEHVNLTVSSPPLTFKEYPSPHVGTMDNVVHYLAVNFAKLTTYAELGFQAPVSIPPHVQRAYSIVAEQLKLAK